MSLRNNKLSIDETNSSQLNTNILDKNKYKSNSIIYSKISNTKNKINITSQINKIKIDLNNNKKFHKLFEQNSSSNLRSISITNLKRSNYDKINNSSKKIQSKKSMINLRDNNKKMENWNMIRYFNYKYNISNESINKNISRNLSLTKRNEGIKSPIIKNNYNNTSFILNTPKINNIYKQNKIKNNYSKINQGVKNDCSLNKNNNNKNNNNNNQKVSNNTDIKQKRKYFIYKPNSINKKKTTINNNAITNLPLCKSTSYDTKRFKYNNNNENFEIISQDKNIKNEINNYNFIQNRNIYINNLNCNCLSFNKKIFFSTENNANSNGGGNSNNNNIISTKKKNFNQTKVFNNDNKIHLYKTKDIEKAKSFFIKNKDGTKEVKGIIEPKKLSFDIFENKKIHNNNKNINKDIFKKICPELNTSINTNQSNLIIRFENKKLKNYFQNQNKNKQKEDEVTSEDNGLQFITETEQGGKTGINSVKTNNFKINKPNEENLKYSSIKEFFDENDDQTEISPSQISNIFIGQIDGYKDIMDDDNNININDKSKNLLELLSKYSFSFIKNNRSSIENLDNFNLFEESNTYIKEANSNIFNLNNSKNASTDNNMPNITEIKNVEEDYDSEDLSLKVFKNNIKSINTHSKVYLNKILFNKSKDNDDNCKDKNNNNCKNCVKSSINSNNTTVSSGKNVNNNFKKNKNLIKINDNIEKSNNKINYRKTNINKVSPASSARNNYIQLKNSNINNSKEKKKKDIDLNKNDKKVVYLKNIIRRNIIKNIGITKRLNTIKSTSNVYKNINTNIIFNSNKKNKNQKKIKGNQLFSSIEKNSGELKNNDDDSKNNPMKKISNNSATLSNFNGENETIINAYFNDIENEAYDNINDKNNNNNAKNFKQCYIF